MQAIEVLQEIRIETEQFLEQLDSGASRLYEISTAGTIVERTVPMRRYYRDILQRLQRVMELLHAERPQH
jgi:hypothetical protein